MMTGNMLLMSFSSVVLMMKACGMHINETDSPWVKDMPHPHLYLSVIIMSLVGAAVYRILTKKREWTAGTFAPLIVGSLVMHELYMSYWYGKEIHDPWQIVLFALVCGIMDSVVLKGGIGSLPWCGTGNLLETGHILVDGALGAASSDDWWKCLKSACMFLSVQAGAMSGLMLETLTPDWWDFEFSMITPLIAVLYYWHDCLYRERPRPSEVEAQNASLLAP